MLRPDDRHAHAFGEAAGSALGTAEGGPMSTRRTWCLAVLFSLAIVPSASFGQVASPEPRGPLFWVMVIDKATYDVQMLEPPLLPASPGRIAVHYEWQANDQIELWWEAVVSGDNTPRSMILYAKNSASRKAKAAISYELEGVRLTTFHGPELSKTGGYSGPSTAILTYQAVKVLQH